MIVGLVRMCRLYYAVPFALGYLLIVFYARGGMMTGHWPSALISTLCLGMVICAGYIFNDIVDRRVDAINGANRPLVQGEVGPELACGVAFVMIAVGIALSGVLTSPFMYGLVAVALGLIIYDVISKKLGVGKQLLVGALMASIYPLAFLEAGGFHGPRGASLYVFPVWLFLSAVGYEILKDLGDVKGDRSARADPTALQQDPPRWRQIANVIVIGATPLAIVPMWMGCHAVYLAIAGVGIALAWTVPFVPHRYALAAVYAEVFLVAFAATVDVVVHGI